MTHVNDIPDPPRRPLTQEELIEIRRRLEVYARERGPDKGRFVLVGWWLGGVRADTPPKEIDIRPILSHLDGDVVVPVMDMFLRFSLSDGADVSGDVSWALVPVTPDNVTKALYTMGLIQSGQPSDAEALLSALNRVYSI